MKVQRKRRLFDSGDGEGLRRSKRIRAKLEKLEDLHEETLDDLQLLQETDNVRQIIDQDENYESRRLRLNQEHRRMQRIRKSPHKNQMQFEKACFFHAPEMHGKLLEVQFKIARHLGWRRRPSNVMENVLQETALDVGRDRVLLICQELLDDIQRQWKRQLKTILFGKIVQDFVKGKK